MKICAVHDKDGNHCPEKPAYYVKRNNEMIWLCKGCFINSQNKEVDQMKDISSNKMSLEEYDKALNSKDDYERMFIGQLRYTGIPLPTREYQFHPVRRWRFDNAWIPEKIAVEIEGAVYTQGRHTRGKGYEEDCRKRNEATDLGWKVFNFSTGMVKSGEAIRHFEEYFDKIGDQQKASPQ